MNNRNRGKNTGDDVLFQPIKELEKLKLAVQDMNYLLSKDYPEKSSSELVASRYKLKTRQIQALRGVSASDQQIENKNSRRLEISDIKNETLHLDGFNVLILLESLLSEAYIFEGLDGCFRDLSGVHGTYKRVQQTFRAIELVSVFFKKSDLERLVWIFDQPVSNSGRIKQMILDFAKENNLNWEVNVEFNPDKFLVENTKIAASSDAWILDHCKKWFNLVGFLIEEEKLSVNLVKMF
jgi:hypothetical protein